MSQTAFMLGKDAVLYYSATPGDALSALTLIGDQIGDLNIDMGRSGGTTIASRASGGWEEQAPGLRTLEITFTITLKPTTDAFALALRTAYLNDAELTIAALTKPKATSGAEGPRVNMTVENYSRGEPVNGAITVDVTLRLSQFLAYETVA